VKYRPFLPVSARASAITAAVAGLLLALAMPPFPLGFLAWLGVGLWLVALEGPLSGFRSGLVFGIVFGLAALFWIGWVTVPGTLALVLISAAEYGLASAAYVRLRERRGPATALAAFALFWILLERVRAAGFIGFPWLNLAHTQLDYLWLFQFVEYTGDLGLSLWVVTMGILLFGAYRFGRPGFVALAALWVGVPLTFGAWRVLHLPLPSGELRVAVVQGDLDTYRKWDDGYIDSSFSIYEGLTLDGHAGSDLVIWPETATPSYLKQEFARRQWMSDLVRRAHVPILTGALSFVRTGEDAEIYNSAYEIHPDGRWEGPYSKQQLVPFGEMIPGAQWFPALSRIDLGQGNFTPGPGPVIFDSARAPHAVLICYESAFSGLAREQVLRGARFLVIITNDSWYGRTPGPYQHAAMAALRAAEFRVGIARAANGGISLFTDRAGRRFGSTRLFTRDMIAGRVELGGAPTFYARHGYWLVWCAAFPGLWWFVGAWRPGKGK
jgi:apolipoprotein N-acyltransferase